MDQTAKKPRRGMKRLVGVVIAVLVFVALTAVLMPSLQKSRELARRTLLKEEAYRGIATLPPEGVVADKDAERLLPRARVKSFKAKIDLTPKISIGTDPPESIYEAKVAATIQATNPDGAARECELPLPLPPALISLADLDIKVNGEPSDSVHVDGKHLIWRGRLDESKPATIEVGYCAVGKGIYTLDTPPGSIIDTYEVTVVANKSDIRMMELSLQPQPPQRDVGKTTYVWKYAKLMFGRAIAIDILGIAPVDRLGGLVWLGPISVLVFGALVALVGLASLPEKFDVWTTLLVVGVFAAAYPLMYFAQDFVSLPVSIGSAAAIVIVIIGLRALTLGLRGSALGILAIAAGVLAIAVAATIYANMQGVLLTLEAVGALAVIMILLPKARKAFAHEAPSPQL